MALAKHADQSHFFETSELVMKSAKFQLLLNELRPIVIENHKTMDHNSFLATY